MSENPVALSRLGQALRGDSKSIRNVRADRVSKQIELHQNELVQGLELKLLDLQGQLDSIMDTGPEHTTSLAVVPKGFDPKKFVEDIHRLSVEISLTRAELDIAKQTTAALFASEAVPS